MADVGWARDLARDLLAGPLPQRWTHTVGVADKAESIARIVGENADLLVCAAWLHDIGYAPGVMATGFHPLDGARYLRDAAHAEPLLCRLVANHSCATIEAEHRGLAGELADEFPQVKGIVGHALTYCDMTTGPDGEPVDVETRLAEIVNRYGDGHLVAQAMTQARPHIEQAAQLVRSLRAEPRQAG